MPEAENLRESLHNLNLARAILIWDNVRNVPENGHKQHTETLAALDAVINRLNAKIDGTKTLVTTTKNPAEAYEKLKEAFAEYKKMGLNVGILEWLSDTEGRYPDDKRDSLNKALVTLKNFTPKSIKRHECKEWLDIAWEAKNTLAAIDQKNLAIMREALTSEFEVSEQLTNQINSAQAETREAFSKARNANGGKGDYSIWKQSIKTLFELVGEKCKIIAPILGFKDPFDVMTRTHNPDLRKETVDKVKAEITESLPNLIKEILRKQQKELAPAPLVKVSIETQKKVIKRVLTELMGLDETRFVLAHSTGAFSCGYKDDCRIAGVYEEDNFFRALFSVVHEGGHLLYNMNLPEEYKYQPISGYQGEGLHETQSIIFERVVGRSREFLEHVSTILHEEMDKAHERFDKNSLNGENLFRLANWVVPGPIRLAADGVTYPLHIIMRDKIERALFSNNLSFDDLPTEWNKQIKELIGVDIENDRQGCLQDSHWTNLNIGYFISYLLGIVGAAQIGAKAEEDIDLTKLIKEKRLPEFAAWLTEKIHQHGSKFTFEEAIQNVTGNELSANAMLDGIKERNLNGIEISH